MPVYVPADPLFQRGAWLPASWPELLAPLLPTAGIAWLVPVRPGAPPRGARAPQPALGARSSGTCRGPPLV